MHLHQGLSAVISVCMLQNLAALHGQDHVLMECSFPADYPNKPFFLRIVTPRMCWYTGIWHRLMRKVSCTRMAPPASA